MSYKLSNYQIWILKVSQVPVKDLRSILLTFTISTNKYSESINILLEPPVHCIKEKDKFDWHHQNRTVRNCIKCTLRGMKWRTQQDNFIIRFVRNKLCSSIDHWNFFNKSTRLRG